MRFVPTKTPEQQSGLVLHRTRHLCIRQQTSVINAIRAHCAEFGIVAPVGRRGIEELLNVIANANDEQVPEIARACLSALGDQLHRIKAQILAFDRMIGAWHRSCAASKRLDEIPGVGPALATARIGHRPWLTALLARRPIKVAAIALANKIARIAWAMMARGERYREPVALAA